MPIHIYKYLVKQLLAGLNTLANLGCSLQRHKHTSIQWREYNLSYSTDADLQQEDGVHDAEQVHQYAHNEQDGPISQTEGVQQEQMARHQAAHQTCHPIQQLHSHYRLHGTRTRVTSFKSFLPV